MAAVQQAVSYKNAELQNDGPFYKIVRSLLANEHTYLFYPSGLSRTHRSAEYTYHINQQPIQPFENAIGIAEEQKVSNVNKNFNSIREHLVGYIVNKICISNNLINS